MYKGKKITGFVSDGGELYKCTPVYRTLKGWNSDLTAIRDFKSLPAAAKAYIEYIEQYTGVRVSIISVGPERDQILKR
jgi:adenylosuccinate synthase